MKGFKFNIRREIKIAMAFLLVVLLIAFSERKQRDVAVQDVQIRLENIAENHFMNEGDVIGLMQLNEENLRGASIRSIDMPGLERKISQERYVRSADIYSDLKGNLVVKVNLRRAIARIVRADGPDGYIAEDGAVMPTSEKFTPRVALVSGSYVRQLLNLKNLNDSEEGKGLIQMLKIIQEDKFWNAQIAQLDIDNHARVTIYPQVGGEIIEFGKPENLLSKFGKMKLYYKEILPQQGWNRYKRVNLEFEGQIVAE